MLLRRTIKRRLLACGLEMASGLAGTGLMATARGHGAIFTLHHVRPKPLKTFQPNAHLEITPAFLEEAIERLRGEDYDFIALHQVPDRLQNPRKKPFAAFTLDDAYRNNAEHALPVFARHDVPFTIFVAKGFAQRTASLWWETLSDLLGRASEIEFDFGEGSQRLDLTSEAQKFRAFERFARYVFTTEETEAVSRIDALARRHGIEPLKITAELTMDAAELRILSAHPLVSFGAHTLSHRAVSRLGPETAAEEMRGSADYVEEVTGLRPSAIAYPYGTREAVSERDTLLARDLGFTVGVTTQPGVLTGASVGNLTGLPRISLNGHFQKSRYVSALASGIPFLFK